ncbi:MAG: potassium channel family protein [Actinomycetota bacterium]|nr:potassium channel family protein [Actinomycetota bacterium]
MTIVCVVVGGALTLVVAWDILLTLLHPTARGPLSYVANRATWIVARWVSIRLLRGRGLSFAGPLAVSMNVYAWVITLWVGYALVYLPFVDSLSYDPSSPFEGTGLAEALYLSGAAVTTVGFGDVAAHTDALRLATTIEAASGFGVLSAAIAFVLSIYPLITQIRGTGTQLADVGALELDGAVRVVREVGPAELAATVRALTQNHEHLRRFPVLYYFESGNREESLSAVVRGSALLLVALRCESKAVRHAGLYADVLRQVLVRLLDDLERDFVGGRRRNIEPQGVVEEDEEARMTALLGRLGASEDGQGEGDPARAELGALLARAERVMEAVAEEHGHQARPLLPDRTGQGDRQGSRRG